MTTDQVAAKAVKAEWTRNEKQQMLSAVHSQEAAEGWLRLHQADFFCAIKFWRRSDAVWGVKKIKWFWDRRFRYDAETFPGPIKQWLFVLKDPKAFGSTLLFSVVSGVPRKFHKLLRDLLHEELGETRIIPANPARLKGMSKRLCERYAEGRLIDFAPLTFKLPYADYPVMVDASGHQSHTRKKFR